MKPQPVIIVLAAGLGSRFTGPSHKLVQPLGAATVLGQTLVHAIESRLPVTVVTTAGLAAEASRWVARRDVVVLPDVGSPGAGRLGMGASIAAGAKKALFQIRTAKKNAERLAPNQHFTLFIGINRRCDIQLIGSVCDFIREFCKIRRRQIF